MFDSLGYSWHVNCVPSGWSRRVVETVDLTVADDAPEASEDRAAVAASAANAVANAAGAEGAAAVAAAASWPPLASVARSRRWLSDRSRSR